MSTPHNSSRSYFGSEVQSDASLDIREKLARSIGAMNARVGLPDRASDAEVQAELDRTFPKLAFDELERLGVELKGARVLDVGAGVGSCSTEAALRGALPVALEPGSGWRELARDRLKEVGRGGSVVAATGESMPFRSASFDVVVSLMVLEHVTSPERVISEVFRVLKPGGTFYLACENYLGFREPHYGVAWLPLMPKRLGAAYLRLRGRPTEYLYDSITYVTRPGVTRLLERSGFSLLSKQRFEESLGSGEQSTGRLDRNVLGLARRWVSDRTLAELWFRARGLRHLCTGPIIELCRKPA
ncbi:MAG TPA: class I SAM-dependent methyltransferase [Polyangiaceae bacterium]|nr:class I SAM-dependent methyltransferase [Polyangiaceae bacterium]